MSCDNCPNLIVTGEYSTKKFECSYFKPHGVPLKSAALEAKVLIKGKPHMCDYKHSEVQNESNIEEVLEIAKQKLGRGEG